MQINNHNKRIHEKGISNKEFQQVQKTIARNNKERDSETSNIPALYRVVHPGGCVIQSGVELSTARIGHAPSGFVLSVVGRSYSNHPGWGCLGRL